MQVVLISGKAEAGKTTAANFLKKFLALDGKRVAKVAYADYLKSIAKAFYNWNGQKDDAGRALLQRLGTDVVRKKEPDFWTNIMIQTVHVLKDEFDVIIIDDVRFPNEITAWEGRFIQPITLRIERPGYENHLSPAQRMHPSETALDAWPRFDDVIFNDSTLDALKTSIAFSYTVLNRQGPNH